MIGRVERDRVVELLEASGPLRLAQLRAARLVPAALLVEVLRGLIRDKRVALIGDDRYCTLDRLPLAAAARAARNILAGATQVPFRTVEPVSTSRNFFSSAIPPRVALFSAPGLAGDAEMRDRAEGGAGAGAIASAVSAALKTCGKCKVEKPRAAFTPHGRSHDGLAANCDDCRGVKRKTPAAAAAGERSFQLPTIHGVYCSVHPERGVMLGEPGANEERFVRLNPERAIEVCRFILEGLGQPVPAKAGA